MRWCVCVCEREVVNMWGKDRVKKAVREQRKGNKVGRMKQRRHWKEKTE